MEAILINWNDLTKESQDELNLKFKSFDETPIDELKLKHDKFGYSVSVKKNDKWQQ